MISHRNHRFDVMTSFPPATEYVRIRDPITGVSTFCKFNLKHAKDGSDINNFINKAKKQAEHDINQIIDIKINQLCQKLFS